MVTWFLYVFQTEAPKQHTMFSSTFILLMFPGKISLSLFFFFLHLSFNKRRVTVCKPMLVPTLGISLPSQNYLV